MSTTESLAARGQQMRRQVHGDERIDAMGDVKPTLTATFEELANNGYAVVWGREDELSQKLRSLVTVAIISTLGEEHEFRAHVRGALRAGWSKQELLEVLLHTVLYAGAPRGQRAMYQALEAFEEWDEECAAA
jgi:4-carboxymuconolactone decarboxylase